MTTTVPATFYEGTPGTSTGLLATVPTGEEWIIDDVIVDNTSGSAATLTLNHGVAGAAAATANQFVSAQSFAANSSTSFSGAGELGFTMQEGDVIRGLQGTGSALNVRITGRRREF